MKNLVLSPGALLLCAVSPAFAQAVQEVTVTASPLIGDAIDQTQSVAEISREDMMASGGFGLGEALRNVPGVTSSGFSPGAARPVIRGFDASRVRVTENGIGSHDASDISADHGVPVDPLSAIEVEVLRGPGTLRYGSQAIGGVVNAINNRIPFDIVEGASVDLFAGGATNAAERMAGGTFGMKVDSFALHADGFARGAESYDTPHGKQPNTYSFGKGFALGGAYIAPFGANGLSFNRYASHYGIASEPGGEVAYIDLTQSNYAGALRLTAPFPGIDAVNGRIGYSDYSHHEIVDDEGVLATFNNREWEGRLEALHKGVGPIASGAIGLQWGTRDFEALGEAADYLQPTTTSSFAGYVFERVDVSERFALEGAARIEKIRVKGATNALGSVNRGFTPASVALGAVFRAYQTLSFSLNLSQTERAPNAVELFAQGPHEASATYEFGDPGLGKERARSIEAGIHYDGADLTHATLNVFSSRFDGFIAGVVTGCSYDEDGNFFADGSGEFAELLYLQRDAHFWGFEAEAHLPLMEIGRGHVGIDLQGDYVRAKFGAGGNVPRIPPLRYGGGVFYESEGMALNLSALHTASQNDTAQNETATDGHTLVDASALFRVYDGAAGALDISLAASNLFDETARNHVSFTKDHVLLPGRNVRLTLHYVY